MKSFLRQALIFSLPITIVGTVFILYAEIRLYTFPSAFRLKAQYTNEHINEINVVVLGSSHNQNAIDPGEFKSFNVTNLAYGSQTLPVDSAILEKYIHKLPKLKIVILEAGYHSLETPFDPQFYRNTLYLRYFKINLFRRDPNLLNYSIFFSQPSLYFPMLNPLLDKPGVNKYGFATEPSKLDDNQMRFEKLKYNETKILADTSNVIITRHRNENIKAFQENRTTLRRMVELCAINKIRPVIVLSPVFSSYYNSYIAAKELRRRTVLSNLQNEFKDLLVLDFERDEHFGVRDFMNEDHLNPAGARKFSDLLEKAMLEKGLFLTK